MWGPRISSEAITISYWCTSSEWVTGISRASCARISIANKILVLRRRTCCQAKQRISFYFGFPWEVACLADALNLLYIDECEGGLQRRLVGVKLFPNVPTEFTNDLFVSIGDSSEETKTKGERSSQWRGVFLWTSNVRISFSSYSGIAEEATKTFRNDSSLFNLKSEKRKSQNRP